MKNMIFIVAGLLMISIFATIGLGQEAGNKQTTLNLTFSNLIIKNDDIEEYLELDFNGAQGVVYQSGAPILPMYSTIMNLPFGTKITSIECKTREIKSKVLDKKIIPAPFPVPVGITVKTQLYTIDETIYNSDELFPNTWFNYYTGAGLDVNSDHKTFLVVQAYPIRYNPITNIINYVESMDLTIKYQVPDTNQFPSTESYQLVIIAPQEFSNALQPLITHKNNYGIQTILKTTEEIYSQYTGVDQPEQIKYFIKDAIETWNIKYVLLVGGLKNIINGNPRENTNYGAKDWFLPVRYTNLKETDSTHDPGFISDLYYADIYNSTGVFCSWDSNSDGIFANWGSKPGKDILDLYPDVYVGRLACTSKGEVNIMVNKIINYEKKPADPSWFNKIIVVGGDSFNDKGTNYPEGEVVSNRIIDTYMSEFTTVKLYASNKNSNPTYTPNGNNVVREVKKGAGHFFLDGHANPYSWTTHWIGEFDGKESWTNHFWLLNFPYLTNGGKLPICCVEGCHNSQFNVTMIQGFKDKDNSLHTWCYGLPIPECWSWWLARKIGGGSIATIGNTGLGYGATGENGDLDGDGITEPDILESLGGYYFDRFYYGIDQGEDILGDCHSGAITNYLNTHPGMSVQGHAKEMEQMILLGDPSLKIGGYASNNNLRAEIIDSEAGIIGVSFEKITFKANSYNAVGRVSYTWDLNEDGIYDDASGEIISHNWKLPGVYKISLKVIDESGTYDIYNTIVGIELNTKTPLKSVFLKQILQVFLGKNPNIFSILNQILGL